MTDARRRIVTHADGESVTETSRRVDGSAALFGRRWAHVAWWLLAWNAAVPIRLVGMFVDAAGRPGFRAAIGGQIGSLILDQTSWAVATYVMFRLALRARRAPLRRVVTLLGVLAVPLMVLRYWGTSSILQALGRPALPVGRMLLFNGPFYFFLLMASAALGLLVVSMQRERDNAVLQATRQGELA